MENTNFDSDYSIRLATLEQMGGDMTKHYDSVYEIDLEILKLTEGGLAITDVDVLPEATEDNKGKIYRLPNNKLYVSEVVGEEEVSGDVLPEEEQIGVAYIEDRYYFGEVTLKGMQGIEDKTIYYWVDGGEDWENFNQYTDNYFTLIPASQITNLNELNLYSLETVIGDDVTCSLEDRWIDINISAYNDWDELLNDAQVPFTGEDSYIATDTKIVKIYDWKELDVTIKDVDTLPVAEDNKDSIVRLSTNGKIYVAEKVKNAPETIQINHALAVDKFSNVLTYFGKRIITCTDGIIPIYVWTLNNSDKYNSENTYCTLKPASNIYSNNDWNGFYWDNLSYDDEQDGNLTIDDIVDAVLADVENIYKYFNAHEIVKQPASEDKQIGNAWLDETNRKYFGEVTCIFKDETHTLYYWVYDDAFDDVADNYFTLKPASELYSHSPEDFITYNIDGEIDCANSDEQNRTFILDGNYSAFLANCSMDVDNYNIVYASTYEWKEISNKPEYTSFNACVVDGSIKQIYTESTTIDWNNPVDTSYNVINVNVILKNTTQQTLSPVMNGNYIWLGNGSESVPANEFNLYKGTYSPTLGKWLLECVGMA